VNAIKELGWAHMPCVAHTLNLVLEHAVLECDQLKALVKKVKRLVKRVRKSTSVLAIALENVIKDMNEKRAKLVEEARLAATVAGDIADKAKASGDPDAAAAEAAADLARQHAERVAECNEPLPLKLKQWVHTRWNSMYETLERLLLLRSALATMLASYTGDGPSQARDLWLCFLWVIVLFVF
jgi:hypothetical protein